MGIRPAQVDDAPALGSVYVDSRRAAYRGPVPDRSLQAFTVEWREESFRQSLAAAAEATYLVHVEGHVRVPPPGKRVQPARNARLATSPDCIERRPYV